MKYLPLLAFALLAGCESLQSPCKIKYTRLTVTDPRGNLIAEWVAEGRVKTTDQGYEIEAVERKTAPPYPQSLRYPNRKRSTVVGANIVLEQIEKPDWLKKLDEEDSPAPAHHSR